MTSRHYWGEYWADTPTTLTPKDGNAASREGMWVRVWHNGKILARFACSDPTLTHVAVWWAIDVNRRDRADLTETLRSVELIGDWPLPLGTLARDGYSTEWWGQNTGGSTLVVFPILERDDQPADHCPHPHGFQPRNPTRVCNARPIY